MADSHQGARRGRRIPALAVLTVVSLTAGCSGGGPAPSVSSTATAQASESVALAPKVDCDAMHAAHVDLSLQLQNMLFLSDDEAYKRQLEGPNVLGLTKLDAAKFRRDIDIIATLPDPGSDNPFLKSLGSVLPQFRELADLLEANLRSGHPFSDGSGNGEKLKKLADQLSIDGRVAILAYEASGCRPK